MTNTTNLTVADKNGNSIESGTAAQLLADATNIINAAAKDNASFTASYRAPNIYIPQLSTTAKIDFADVQTFENYLQRSTSYLIPESAIAASFQATLGRAPAQSDLDSFELQVDSGASLSTLQWTFAHSAEAQNDINTLFVQVDNRPIDQPSLGNVEATLGSESLAAESSNLR